MHPPERRRRPTGKLGAPSKDHPHNDPVNSRDRADAQADLRFRRDVRQLHQLGPRATYELLAELGQRRMCRTEIELLVGYYARQANPELIGAVGGDRLPPLPPPRLVRPT